MDFEVAPDALRRGGARLRELSDRVRGDAVVPVLAATDDWAATAAAGVAAAAGQRALARLADRAGRLGDALRTAADGYERADEQATVRFRRLGW